MRHLAILTCLFLLTLGAPAVRAQVTVTDSYVMGAGRWSCTEALAAAESGDAGRVGQLAGWILGAWSLATAERGTGFTDRVQTAGGRGVFEATLGACRGAPGSTPLYRVTFGLIADTAGAD